jgi:peroxiredoxin
MGKERVMSHDSAASETPAKLPVGRLVLVAGLFLSGLLLLGWTAVRAWTPAPLPADLAQEAKDYLRERKVIPLSAPLASLLADPDSFLVPPQDLPLLGKPAPDFLLPGHGRSPLKLAELVAKGPVVVVFYYGYHCNHCVGQLFALNDDLAKFRELGAEVVAISPDPPELTAKRYAQYGAFSFPVLSDKDNLVARAYGVYVPPMGDKDEDILHGTFLVNREGIVFWAMTGDEPFTNNRTLLYELANSEGRLPANPAE